MTPLFTKLNLGSHREIVVLSAPESFAAELASLEGVAIHTNVKKVPSVGFAIVFVQTLAQKVAAEGASIRFWPFLSAYWA